MVILVLFLVWLVLLVLTFRAPTPSPSRLLFFLCFLGATGGLIFMFAVKVLKWNPNPLRVELAHMIMEDKFIDLAEVAPGVYDLEYIETINTDVDGDASGEGETRTTPTDRSWLVFYQYDVVDPLAKSVQGPFGAAIYSLVNCQPPSILSYDLLTPVGSPLGEDKATVEVENVMDFEDPLSVADGKSLDRPEIIINGYGGDAVTDLNVFRKVGVQLNCLQQRQWRAAHPGDVFPNSIRYENVGSFHGTYLVKRDQATITTLDRNTMDRSQIVTQRIYEPRGGSYFRVGTHELLDPVETGLVFSPGPPNVVTEVHYPEKAVLAFYLALGSDGGKLAQAEQYLTEAAQDRYDIDKDAFGLAIRRAELERVLVWEIGYEPDVQAEQLRQPRPVQVTIVGVDTQGTVHSTPMCRVTWRVIGVPSDKALPYGCEWRLESYVSTCSP